MTTTLLFKTVIFLLIAIPSSIIDIRRFRIPLMYVCGGIAIFVFADVAQFLRGGASSPSCFFNEIEAVVSSFLVFLAARVFSGGGLGKGDIVFGVFAALYTGFYSNMVATVFAALIGILFYLLLKIVENHSAQDNVFHPIFAIPFVPFITAGALLSKFLFLL